MTTSFDPRALRTAFGSYLTGVTVVTTQSRERLPVGFTANSFSSVSLDPPLLLVCPAKSLSTFEEFQACSHFAVNILAEGQEEVSNTFAAYKGDRFAKVAWRPDAANCPLIDGAVAQFSCSTHKAIDAGDHTILLGKVDAFTHTGGPGLGYAAGKYFSLGLEREAAAAPQPGMPARAGALIVDGDQILLQRKEGRLEVPEISLESGARVREALQSQLSDRGTEIAVGRAYSVFTDRVTNCQCTYFLATFASQAGNPNPPDTCELVPIASLKDQALVPGPQTIMLHRFALEHETQAFTLYVGDETAGDTHPIVEEN